MTFLVIVLYLFILLVPVFGSKIIDAIDYFNIKSVLTSLLGIMQGPISWVIIFIFIKVIFTLAPNKSVDPVRINVGAIFTSLGFILCWIIKCDGITFMDLFLKQYIGYWNIINN